MPIVARVHTAVTPHRTRRHLLVPVALLVALTGAVITVPRPAPSAAAPAPTDIAPPAASALTGAAGTEATRFEALDPTRILDTRTGIGAPRGRVPAKGSVTTTVAGANGVPADAVAVALTVTVTDTSPGYIQVLPTGQAAIGSFSTLNVDTPRATVANHATVPVGANGQVTVYADAGAHVIADVSGYYVAATSSSSGRYTALTPQRIMDTRDGTGMPAPAVPPNPGDIRNCDDFRTWAEANAWFWTYFPHYGDIARLDGDDDRIPCEALPGASSTPAPPSRAAFPRVPAGQSVTLDVAGRGGVPASGVSAVVVNVTMTEAAGAGFVQLVPAGGGVPIGSSSNVNVDGRGQTAATMAVVPLGSSGDLTVHSSSGAHVIVDVLGWFTDDTGAVAVEGLYVPLTPGRLLDTRGGGGSRPADRSSTTVAPLGQVGVPATGVAAVMYNLTLTQASGVGFAQLYPTGRATPGSSSSVNVVRAGQTVANAAVGALGNGGTSSLYVLRGAHLIVDVFGYVTGPGWTPPAPVSG